MKKILAVITAVILLFGAVSFVGCGDNNVAEHEHEYGEWTIVKETNSCKVEGIREHKCSVCGKTEQESFYGEHDARSVWHVETESHYKICRRCGQRFSEGAHFYTDGKCVCGKEEVNTAFWDIPDFTVEVPTGRNATVLLLADTQIIDSTQNRKDDEGNDVPWPDGLWDDDKPQYVPTNMDALCFNYIRAAVSAANPDLIILVGDNIFGRFDDEGTSLQSLIATLESFNIPWAPINGNHDNESAKGAKWQNAQFEAAEHCLFKKGDTDGNGNYTVAIKQGDEITRMFYLMDSNKCVKAADPVENGIITTRGFTANQVKWMYDRMEALEIAYGKAVKSSLCFHIPTSEYTAAAAQHYSEGTSFDLGKMTMPVGNVGDYGHRIWSSGLDEYEVPGAYGNTFLQILKTFSVDTTFCGHNHVNNTSIMYEGIRWTYVLKTGRYDGHQIGELGGTKFSFNATAYSMNHVYCG